MRAHTFAAAAAAAAAVFLRRARSPAPAREPTNGRKPEALQSGCRGTSRCTRIVTSAQPSASRRSRLSADGGRRQNEEDEDGDEFAEAAASAAAGPATDARPLRSADAGAGSGCC